MPDEIGERAKSPQRGARYRPGWGCRMARLVLRPSQTPLRGRKVVFVIDWLLDSDPATRWQAMRDLTDAPADQVAAERARVAAGGWGARLPARRRDEGRGTSGTPGAEGVPVDPRIVPHDDQRPGGPSGARARNRRLGRGDRGA